MQTLILKIDTANHAFHLANFLKHLPYIKSITPQPIINEDKPLTDADWVRSGRPATEKELEQLCVAMDTETKEMDASLFFKQLKKKYKK